MEGIFKQDQEQSIKTEFSDLPNCILFNILRRLPLKSIFICKCVSKQWCSFISDPSFGRLYATTIAGGDSVSSVQWNLLFRFLLETRILSPEIAFDRIAFERSDSNFASKGFSLDFLTSKKTSPAKILAASNGLLLCSDAQFWQKRYFVCNPLTCQWTSLPPPILTVQWAAAGLVASEDSFLVVRISKIFEDPDLLCVIKIETFCSKTRMWQLSTVENKSAVADNRLCIKTDTPVVEHNRILHWLESHHKIITFDLEKNQIGSIKLPRKNHGRKVKQLSLIGLTEGQLGYLEVTDSCVEPRDLRLWLLRDYEHIEWTLEHEIRIGECRTSNEGPMTEVTREKLFVFPLALDPFDAQVVYLMMGGWLFSCNVRIGRLWVVRRRICSNQVLPFVIPPWPATVPHLDRSGC